jgi:FKBP-type peptidyl-prolyl cis-trans isomerase
MKSILIFAVFGLLFTSCNSQEQKQELQYSSKKDFDEAMIESHKKFIQKSDDAIAVYIDSSNYTFETTGTGLRHAVIAEGVGVIPKIGDQVKINYIIRFLDGEPVLDFEKGRNLEFFIEKSDVETGLHQALQLMKVGEKAEFIFPPHLAFGMTGDRNGIPPQSTLIYTIELLAVR